MVTENVVVSFIANKSYGVSINCRIWSFVNTTCYIVQNITKFATALITIPISIYLHQRIQDNKIFITILGTQNKFKLSIIQFFRYLLSAITSYGLSSPIISSKPVKIILISIAQIKLFHTKRSIFSNGLYSEETIQERIIQYKVR